MKTTLVFLFGIGLCSFGLGQNVGIGTDTPDATAQLEIRSGSKGLLIPRTSSISRTAIVNPAKGLMLYDTTTSSFWFYDAAGWVEMGSTKNSWFTKGNINTTASTDFIGTGDDTPLSFRVNNERAGKIDQNNSNLFFGHLAGSNDFIGQYNTAVGEQAIYSNINASFNTGVGAFVLRYDTAIFNTGIGFQALYLNTAGINNTAAGAQALSSNTLGKENTAVGNVSLDENTTGNYNTAAGSLSLKSNTTGNNNTAIGYQALFNNTTGADNVAAGINALIFNHVGVRNVAIGSGALYSDFSGSGNVALGDSALFHYAPSGAGIETVAIGSKALFTCQSGTYNTAIGAKSLYSATGNFNTALGYETMYASTTGNDNIAIGYHALYSNTTGSSNMAIGDYALVLNTTGYESIAIGQLALSNITTGSSIAIGYDALSGVTTGTGNIGIGVLTSTGSTGSNNTMIGTQGGTVGSKSYAVTLGSGSVANCNNCLILGGNTAINRTRVAININAPATDLHIIQQSDDVFSTSRGIRLERPNGDQWRTFIDPNNDYVFQLNNSLFSYIEPVGGTFIANSDARLKKDVLPMDNVLSKVLELRAKSFQYIINSDTDRRLYGFIAQDVEKVFPDFVVTSEAGYQGIAYSNFGVVAVKAIQEQQEQINDLKAQNQLLQEQITVLTKRLEALEKHQ